MNDQQATQLLERMVAIPSVSGQEAELARFLRDATHPLGFDSRVDEVGNFIATIGDGDLHGVLLGHIDTVPGELPVHIENGVLHGRGSVDAKGSMACFIAAAHRLHEQGRLPHRLVIIGCVEEEAPSSRGARHVAPRYSPEYCVIGEPSGWDGITLGYKGYLRADLWLEQDGAHSAHEVPTVSERACELWVALRDEVAAFNHERTRLFDRLLPALNGISSESDGRRERARLGLSLRLPPDLDPLAATSWLRERSGDAWIEVLGSLPAWSGPRTTPLAKNLFRAIKRAGGTPVFKQKTGTADLNIVAPAWGCPALAYGPGDASLDHTPEERIDLAEYHRAIEILAATIQSLGAKMTA